ncbi:MAG: hypothetical protein IK089_06560, partial [Oxalobacter sp.]|nr:hypothetical protein [Oxalobacter sp.]
MRLVINTACCYALGRGMGLFSSMAMDFRKIPLIAGISLLAAVLVGCGEQKETALKAGAPTKSLTSQDLMIIGD